MTSQTHNSSIGNISEEQLPIPKHKLKGWTHFLGLYAGEHVAATEFVFGATFVALGATMTDILLGLLIGNILAVLSWTFITTPIAVETRLSLYTYLQKIAGDSMTKLYNWANVIIFTVISAAMITVSATAVRFAFDIPAQLNWYPTNAWFVAIVLAVGVIVVLVAMYGSTAVSNFSGICAPWLLVMFVSGPLILMPALADSVIGQTGLSSWSDFMHIGSISVWTGLDANGEPGIGLLEVIGFSWAANTITHFGLIDMAILRYARKRSYGVCTSAGMLFGHYIAWISAGIMGAGTAVIVQKSIVELDPGDVAYHELGLSLLTYAGLLVVPVGAIVFAEHFIFPRIGYTRYWVAYRQLTHSRPAVVAWGLGLAFGFGLNALDILSFYYLFIPTWFFTIFVYTVMAKRHGAAEKYPEEQAKMEAFNQSVELHQEEQARNEPDPVIHISKLTKSLRVISIASLVVTFALACNTMFFSADLSGYEVNRDMFFNVGFACTLIYFFTAYWAMQRKKIAVGANV